MSKQIKYILLPFILLFSACTTNDFKPEYQKEMQYDGYTGAFDTITINTYIANVENGVPTAGRLFSTIIKWYDFNGYHSMTESFIYINGHQQKTTEQITRDKYSLPVARNIVIESSNTEPLVTLARLKIRRNGEEQWLFRHYLDPKKYLEDATTILYTETERITKKQNVNTNALSVIEIETFNRNGQLANKSSLANEVQLSTNETFYNPRGLIDSVATTLFGTDDSSETVKNKQVEHYRYELNENSNISRKYISQNDSLIYISEYIYSKRD